VGGRVFRFGGVDVNDQINVDAFGERGSAVVIKDAAMHLQLSRRVPLPRTVQFGAFRSLPRTDGNTLSLGELFFVALKETVVTKAGGDML